MNTFLYRLLQLSDPALPIGGYAHSAGLETYVQLGLVNDPSSARSFVTEMLRSNIHYTDGALLSLAYDAASHQQLEKILELDAICTAVKLPREIRQASQKLGMRMLKIYQPLMGEEVLQAIGSGHYCIVFGMLAALLHVPKEEALTGYYYTTAAGMVTNCVKLVPLSQQHGQELLFSLQPLITELAAKNLDPDMDMIGLCCPGFDIRSMQHERLYSRLYMS